MAAETVNQSCIGVGVEVGVGVGAHHLPIDAPTQSYLFFIRRDRMYKYKLNSVVIA